MSGLIPRAEDGARSDSEDGNGRAAAEEFISLVAHELATPLSAISLWINLLSNQEDLAPATREGLEVIRQAAEEQQSLIDALVDISLISSHRLRLRLRPTDMGDVVRAAVDSIRSQMEARHLVFQTEIGWDLGLLDADAPRLQRSVRQLLGNAMKFTPRGGQVTLRARREANQIVIAVTDTGAGLAPEMLPAIFERLEQGWSKQRGAPAGLGLGLSIARHVVEMHGGSIAGESAGPGQGATFTIRLPSGGAEPKGAGAPRPEGDSR